jgi:hypothetical protein
MLRHYRTRNSTTNDVCVRRDSRDVLAAMTARSPCVLALRHSPLDVTLSFVTDGCWDGARGRAREGAHAAKINLAGPSGSRRSAAPASGPCGCAPRLRSSPCRPSRGTSVRATCRGGGFCAACAGAANAIRASNSTIILISVSELFRHHARSTRTRTRSFCEIFVTLARTPCLTCCVLPCIDRAHGARGANRENAAHATPTDGPRRYGGRAERQERTTCAREWLACVAVGDSEILLSQKRARPSRTGVACQ